VDRFTEQKELKSRHGPRTARNIYDKNENSIRNARANRIKLGLDLQGGMYVTLEVNIGENARKKLRKTRMKNFVRSLPQRKRKL